MPDTGANIDKYWRGYREKGSQYTTGANVNLYNHYGKPYGDSSLEFFFLFDNSHYHWSDMVTQWF